jgi:hypothetical protein
MLLTLLKWLTIAIMFSALSVLLYLSRIDFFIAAGSDVLTIIVRPAIWAQIMSLLLVPLTLYACLFFSFRKAMFVQCLALLISLFAFVLSIHSFVIDAKSGNFKDVWGPFEIQRMPFDFVEGPAHDVTYDTNLFWLTLYRGQERIKIFLGIAPWRISADHVMRNPLMVNTQSHE